MGLCCSGKDDQLNKTQPELLHVTSVKRIESMKGVMMSTEQDDPKPDETDNKHKRGAGLEISLDHESDPN